MVVPVNVPMKLVGDGCGVTGAAAAGTAGWVTTHDSITIAAANARAGTDFNLDRISPPFARVNFNGRS
jgi:hypothetical protein